MKDTKKVLSFLRLTHDIQRVERVSYTPATKRRENDQEHQYQLAMLAWYLIDLKKLKLDKSKAMKYALVHDIVEAYAGDTFAYASQKGKAAREKKAMRKLQRTFPEFKDLHVFIHGFESHKDKEARFIYALDKIIPTYNNYMEGGRIWKKERITLEMIAQKKREKISLDDTVKKLFEELLKLLNAREKDLFK